MTWPIFLLGAVGALGWALAFGNASIAKKHQQRFGVLAILALRAKLAHSMQNGTQLPTEKRLRYQHQVTERLSEIALVAQEGEMGLVTTALPFDPFDPPENNP